MTGIISHSNPTRIVPGNDTTTAIQFLKSDGVSPVATIDSLNSRLGVGTTAPETLVHGWKDQNSQTCIEARNTFNGSGAFATVAARADSAANTISLNAFPSNSTAGGDLAGNTTLQSGKRLIIRNYSTDSTIKAQGIAVQDRDGNELTTWDLNNLRVGIRTTSPEATLHVSGTFKLTPSAAAPLNPTEGTLYYDSGLKKLRCYDGAVWQNCW